MIEKIIVAVVYLILLGITIWIFKNVNVHMALILTLIIVIHTILKESKKVTN